VKSTYPTAPAGAGQVHPDGSIRCPYGFHSVLPEAGDVVEIRARAAIFGDQLAKVPFEALAVAVRDVLAAAGIEPVETATDALPPLHDCDALIRDSLRGAVPQFARGGIVQGPRDDDSVPAFLDGGCRP